MISLFRSNPKQFRTRSPERDEALDESIFLPVAEAIEQALTVLETQKDGLERRIRDATAFASLAAGNDVYEHETREPSRTESLRGFEKELETARKRQVVVESHIVNLRFVRAVFLSRFPGTGASNKPENGASPHPTD